MTTDAIIMTVEGVRTRASTQEVLVTFAVPIEQAALVLGLASKVGQQVGAAFANVEPSKNVHGHGGQKTTAPSGTVSGDGKIFGQHAKALKLSGFTRSPEVWRAIGTDDEFRAWIQRQPSAWSGEFSEWVNGDGRCEAAHVSRIEYGRGIGHKPDYACIPLTHAEHMDHHAKGESVFDTPIQRNDGGFSNEVKPGRQWMEEKRIKYVEAWAWDTLKATLGYDSMARVPPLTLINWAQRFHVEHLLPKEYGQP